MSQSGNNSRSDNRTIEQTKSSFDWDTLFYVIMTLLNFITGAAMVKILECLFRSERRQHRQANHNSTQQPGQPDRLKAPKLQLHNDCLNVIYMIYHHICLT